MSKISKQTTTIGREAELVVAKYLEKIGYKIIAKNWRNRWCEIDIIATKKGIVYFVEVKYRHTNAWGDGLDAITKTKLKQMNFAAQNWLATNTYKGNAQLLAVGVTGEPPEIDEIIEID